jgi:arsenical pump membrane protein
MERVGDHLTSMLPALAFLCAGVPLAALLDRLGFFDSVAILIERRRASVPVGALWVLAALTTALLNLDTTVVLLTPLYVRLARRCGIDPLPLAVVPLLLASFASSVLPVSNLTTLIAADRLDLSVSAVVSHLALPSAAACVAGWLAYRRRYPRVLFRGQAGEPDPRALTIGTVVVTGLLIGFVLGPSFGIAPWMVAVAADLVLAAVTRSLPWRDVPLLTAFAVAGLAALAALVVPSDLFSGLLSADNPLALAGIMGAGTIGANLVNNLPALLIALDGVHQPTWGLWAWLAGINTGAALLPIGALANLLWWRVLRDEDVSVPLRQYVRITVPIVIPALAAAAGTLALERVLAR